MIITMERYSTKLKTFHRNNFYIYFSNYLKVYLFPSNEEFQTESIKKYLHSIDGDPNAKGEYFGASLLAIDINNDKMDDLIIGAPFYSDQRNREMGRIYVFMNIKVWTQF